MQDNIALISWDSVRADHLPMYGYDRMTTPTLSEVANDGLVFDDTFVSGVGTPTSFSGIFTGEHAHGVQTNISPKHWRASNKDRRLLSEAMQDAGYYTGAFHANALMSEYYGWNRGWNKFEDHLWTKTNNSNQTYDHRLRGRWAAFKKAKIHPVLQDLGVAGEVIHIKNLLLAKKAYAEWESLWDNIEAFIKTAPEPWFLWVLLVDTHHPWCAPEQYRRWQQPGLRRMHLLNYVMRRYPASVSRWRDAIINAYDNELRHADAFLEQLDAVFDDKELDPILILQSDHGDELGEHNDYGHAPAMWDTVTHVPLIMRNVGQHGRVKGPHSLLNLGSTILDLAESEERLNNQPSYFDDEYEPDTVYIENREMDGTKQAAVTDGEWKIMHQQNTVHAYNRRTDAQERTSRIADAPNRLLDELGKHVNDKHEAIDTDEEIHPETVARLKELGYL